MLVGKQWLRNREGIKLSTMKGCEDPEFRADTTAVIENGVYAVIESCDGMKFGSFQGKVIVLPGNHAIKLTFCQTLWGAGLTIQYSSTENRSY
jgi:hypothetical protein